MTKDAFIRLCERIGSGQSSKEDLEVYMRLLDSASEAGWKEEIMGDREESRRALKSSIDAVIRSRHVPAKVIRFRRWAATAAVLLVCVAGIWYYQASRQVSPSIAKTKALPDIPAPNGSRTVLTLAGGRQVFLDSVGNGQLAVQAGTKIEKSGKGQIAYMAAGAAGEAAVTYNTLSTGRGGQARLVLPDGSKVWLNAASSVRFPTAFDGMKRVVEMTGEAYFEIARNPEQPFTVKTGGTKVDVLGTEFNVMAYSDEISLQTTLLQGAVKVVNNAAARTLRPGQQAMIDKGTGGLSLAPEVDTDAVLAWKNGNFEFNGQDIQAVMRQVARWYDVEVVYQGAPRPGHFYGVVSRTGNLSDVLQIFKQANIHYTIEGKRLTIQP